MSTEQPHKLTILINEREDMRRTVSELDKGLFKTLFAFLTITLTIIAIDERIIGSRQEISSYVSFLLTQILMFIGFFAISQLSLKTRTLGYIRALEDKINKLSGRKLVFFHSKVTSHSDFKKPHLWSIVSILIIVVAFLVYLVSLFAENVCFLALLIFESILIAVFLRSALRGDDQVQRFATKLLEDDS